MILRTKYQITYAKVLSFREYYKAVINPYFTIPKAKYSIENLNSLDETISLILSASGSEIIFSNSSISINSDHTPEMLLENGSDLQILFRLYKNLIETFPYIKDSGHETVELIGLKSMDKKNNDIVESFLEIHGVIPMQNGDPDFRVTFTNKSGQSDSFHLDYGVYRPTTDNSIYKIYRYNEELRNAVSEKSGYLIRLYKTKKMKSAASKKTCKTFVDSSNEYMNKIMSKL